MDFVYEEAAERFDRQLEGLLKESEALPTNVEETPAYEASTSDDTRRTGGLRRIAEHFASDHLQDTLLAEHRVDASAVINAHASEKAAAQEIATKQAAVLDFIEAAKSLKG